MFTQVDLAWKILHVVWLDFYHATCSMSCFCLVQRIVEFLAKLSGYKLMPVAMAMIDDQAIVLESREESMAPWTWWTFKAIDKLEYFILCMERIADDWCQDLHDLRLFCHSCKGHCTCRATYTTAIIAIVVNMVSNFIG